MDLLPSGEKEALEKIGARATVPRVAGWYHGRSVTAAPGWRIQSCVHLRRPRVKPE